MPRERHGEKRATRMDHNFSEVLKTVSEAIDTPEAQVVRTAGVAAIGAAKPVAGVFAASADGLLSRWNSFKLGLLLRGLASGLNTEKYLNELYNYVNASSAKAITVANVFQQTLDAASPRVCILYGLILGDHLADKKDFSFDELIVCNALKIANDQDLDNFKEIMEGSIDDSKKVIIDKVKDLGARYLTTCDWCVYNRLFASESFRIGNNGTDNTLALDTEYYTSKPADILMSYIDQGKPVWDYGKN